MKLVIAPDSFKECLSAVRVADAIATGWRKAVPDSDVVCVPMADGGEGTVEAVAKAAGGQLHTSPIGGPLGESVNATWTTFDNGETAVVEMAAAAGLGLAPPAMRDPRLTTTRGVGELMLFAAEAGCRRIIVGLGGSATNDGGAGMAQALGYRLLDEDGRELPPGGAALRHLARIDSSGRNPLLDGITVIGATDVQNPLCGPNGASSVFGPQKGADTATVAELDTALNHFAQIVARDLDVSIGDQPGAGAAGGLGAGLLAFADAELRSGIELVAKLCRLPEVIAGADLVISGEGKLDGQSMEGKTPLGVAAIAAARCVPVVLVAGALGDGWEAVYNAGVAEVYALSDGEVSEDDARAQASELLEALGATLARQWDKA